MAQKREFKAEVRQLLDLVIHSLYSKKEIFLRELISNASDAIERAQYEALTDKTIIADGAQWQIGITINKEQKTITITDNGIGMSAEELDESLGTIARSGTRAFLENIKKQEGTTPPELIGQFGVGFYAAFIVAGTVKVVTRRRGENTKPVCWQSAGDGSYEISDIKDAPFGTSITLHLRAEQEEYLDAWRIRDLVRRYSDFISYPIRLAEDGKEIDEKSEPLNTMRALWKRSKSEIKKEDLNEFYRHLTHDGRDPLKSIHIAAEGAIEFQALLFIPREAPFDLYMGMRNKSGLSLYVRNVFIGADFETLLPEHLRFVRGVVACDDLPLNVSREMLQDDVIIRKIRSNLVGRILSTLAEMQKDKYDDYLTFYKAFGRALKEGFHYDHENQNKLQELVLFHSARSETDRLVSLKQYRDSMPSTQTEIFYLLADNLETARQSPHLENVLKHEYDVLLMTDPIDQWVADALESYDGCKLRAIDKGGLELGSETEKSETKRKLEKASKDLEPLLKLLKEKLGDDIKEVRLSSRLADSACCLVADESAMNPAMERLMRAMNQSVPKQARILEVNPDHAVIKRLQSIYQEDADNPKIADYAELLYGQALIGENNAPRNPQKFTRLIADLMAGV